MPPGHRCSAQPPRSTIDMLIDLADFLGKQRSGIDIWQGVQTFFNRHLDAGPRLLFFAPVQHQFLTLEGSQEIPHQVFDLGALYSGERNGWPGEGIKER